MGLDMYLTGRKDFWHNWKNEGDNRREDGKRVKSLDVELGYWRKHPNLHGYIVKTFASGVDDCKEIELDGDKLRNIIDAVKQRKLPKTDGFFFGSSDGSAEEREADLKILREALDWLEAGDESPMTTTPMATGPVFRMVEVRPKPEAEVKPQNITRSVYYRGDW
jgi:hypothetical protein